jgi:prophage regulatory protein
MNQTIFPPLMRLPEVMEMTGMSKATIYRYMRSGTFPKNVCLGERAVAWRGGDISEWISSLT